MILKLFRQRTTRFTDAGTLDCLGKIHGASGNGCQGIPEKPNGEVREGKVTVVKAMSTSIVNARIVNAEVTDRDTGVNECGKVGQHFIHAACA